MNNFFCNHKTQKSDPEHTFSEIDINYRRDYSKGKSFKVSIWNEIDTYNNDDFIQDFVIYNQSLWARIDSTPSTNEVPTEGPWTKVMDGVSDVQFKEEENKIFWKYEDESEWKDLFELDVVSESEIKNMLKDIATDVDSNFYDKTLSETSINAVQNKVITQALNKKADKTELSKKQDVISDLNEIRNKAKSALQSVPSEYVTESELANKGYLTEHQDISGKQDKIADLAQIRANAQKGATALQSVPEKYATKTDVSNAVEQKADKSELVIKGSKGKGSALQEVEVESFVDEHPDSPTSGQEIPTEASGNHSVVLNGKSNAGAKRALAHGNRTIAQGENSHTEGHCTQTIYVDEVINGYAAHAEGYGTLAGGTYSHTEGNKTKTAAPNSHAEGYLSVTMPEAESAHAEGYETSAEAPASHTEGNKTKTSRAYSHAEGRHTETIGEASHTEGNDTITEGDYAHAEGWMTRAKGAYSHSEGQYTFTYADAAHSEGNNTHAQAPFSHAEGIGTKTNPNIAGQHVEGYFNAESDGVKVVGCGTSDEDRKNAVEVKQDGRVFVKGLGNYDGTNSNEASDLKNAIDNKANSGDVYNKTELDNRIKADLVQKVEVATINGKSLINGGNIVIEGGGSSYDDRELREAIADLEETKVDNPVVISIEKLGNPVYSEENATAWSVQQAENAFGMPYAEIYEDVKKRGVVFGNNNPSLYAFQAMEQDGQLTYCFNVSTADSKTKIEYWLTFFKTPEAINDTECVIVLASITVDLSYDDTEVKNELARLEREKADKSKLTELSEEIDALLDEKLYAYPVEIYEGPEPKVVGLGGEKLYNYLGEISIPADMQEVEGTLSGDALIQTEYTYQSVYEGVLQPYFDFEYDERYLNLYIGNDKLGYTSLKIEPSEDPNNLKWFDAIGFGMFQEGPGSISFAYSNWTLHYKASYVMPCNIKVYCLYKAQKLDVNLIPQEIARKEDISPEIIKSVKNYNNSKCFASFINYVAENGNTYNGLYINRGELGSKLLTIGNYMEEDISISFQYEREDENEFYYSSDVADIRINKTSKFLEPESNLSVHLYSITPYKIVCKTYYDRNDDTFNFSEYYKTQGYDILGRNTIDGIKIYLEYDSDIRDTIDSAYFIRSNQAYNHNSLCCVYLKNRYIEFKIKVAADEMGENTKYRRFSLEKTKEIDITSLESRLAALESINVNIEATLNTEV